MLNRWGKPVFKPVLVKNYPILTLEAKKVLFIRNYPLLLQSLKNQVACLQYNNS